MAKTIHLPCKNKPLHTAECSECGQIESRVAAVEEKLDTIQEGAEVNVQADWDETDPTSDSYILNKPNITPNTVDSELSATSTNPVQNRIITGALASKQDTLVSGTNIKTVNGNTLLGSGDITIQSGGDKNIFYADGHVTSATTVQVDVYGVPTFSDDTLFYLYFVDDAFTPADGMTFNFYEKGRPTLLKSIVLGLYPSQGSHEYPQESNIAFFYSEIYNELFIDTVGMASALSPGLVRLITSTSSTSTTDAATPASVKSAYDLANGKQDALVSGTNIKTVNGNSLLGSGDLTIQSGANITTVTVPITVAAWGGTTVCTVTVNGVTTSNDVIVSPAPTMIVDYVAAGIYCRSQDTNQLEFECSTTPTTALLVHVMIVG